MLHTSETPFAAHMLAWRIWLTHELAQHLIGTPGSVASAAQEYGHPEWEDYVDAEELDSLAFECTNCGWWCSADECNDHPETDEWICDECLREISDD